MVTGPDAGKSYELPYLGKFAWENSVASPNENDTTLVVASDDTTPGQIYIYKGTKQSTGNEVEKAGLTNGVLLGLAVSGVPVEDRISGLGTTTAPFLLANLGDVSGKTAAQLEADGDTAGVTDFLRPEDATWDSSDPSVFYFVTTDRYDQVKDGVGATVGRSRLWKVQLDSATNPTSGTITALLDGTEAHNMLDNMTDDGVGHLILQEDVGNQQHNGKIWQYTKASDELRLVAQHDPGRFGDIGVPATSPFNQDEESSGVIPAFDLLGPGWFLIDDQTHYSAPAAAAPGVPGAALLLRRRRLAAA